MTGNKRQFWALTAVVLMIAGVAMMLFSNFTSRSMVEVDASISEVANQYTRQENWKNWYPRFNEMDSLEIQNPVTITLFQRQAPEVSYISAESSANGIHTNIFLQERLKGYKVMERKLTGDTVTIIHYLKSFMEDDSRRYGFPITVVPVRDILILTARTTVDADKKNQATDSLLQALTRFVNTQHLATQINYYFISSVAAGGQLEVAAGIPVNKEVSGQNGFAFLKLPANGRLVSGHYKGPFLQKEKIYSAMDKYIFDKKLKKVAQPLEQHLMSDTALHENEDVDITVYYPVF